MLGGVIDTQPTPIDPLEEIFDNTFVYICDRVDNYYTPTKSVPVSQECAIIGLTSPGNHSSATINNGSSVFITSSPYVHNTKNLLLQKQH